MMTGSPLPPAAAHLGAVVVAYHPDAGLAERLAALAPQLDKILLVDNSEGPASAALTEAGQLNKVELIRLGRNEGIARALNIGLERLRDRGFSDAITLDQDSTALPGLVSGLLAVRAQVRRTSPAPLLVAPGFAASADVQPHATVQPAWREVYVAITSGMLIHLPDLARLGPRAMDERLFIDYVDFDFCLRARDQGFRIVQTENVLLRHAIGIATQHRLLGRSFSPTNHAPLRRYYRYRNLVRLARRHGRRHGRWLAAELLSIGRELVKIVLFERQRRRTFRAILTGIGDGLRGRSGKLTRSF